MKPPLSRIDFGPWRRSYRGPGRWAARVSGVANTRAVALLIVCVLASVGTTLLALTLGKYELSPADVVRALGGADLGFASRVVLEWRLPRAIAALVFGAGLGVAGAIFQSVTRNPLGSPDVIGLGAGAFTGALIATQLGDSKLAVTLGALVGGLAAGAIVYALAYRRGLSGVRFVVVGIALASGLTGVNALLLLRMNTFTATAVSVWGQGSLGDLRWPAVIPIMLITVTLLAASAVLAPGLRLLELGDTAAATLGLRVERTRLLLLICGIALTAVITGLTGPIAFAALIAPQLARLIAGSAGATLAGAAAVGALLLSAADVAAAHFFPVSVPVGVVTAVLGGCYLLWLLVREARRA